MGWYPFIRLDVDPRTTAVVGANESGKSHLLDAVQKLLTDEQVDRQDFCRYSDLYSVERGERRVSDFAGQFRPETGEDKALMTTLGYSGDEELYYVRSGNGGSFVFTRHAPERSPLSNDGEAALRASFPQVFRLETEVALPASMPIRRLADHTAASFPDRARRRHILGSLPNDDMADTEVPQWWSTVRDFFRSSADVADLASASDKEFELGRRLLIDVKAHSRTLCAENPVKLASVFILLPQEEIHVRLVFQSDPIEQPLVETSGHPCVNVHYVYDRDCFTLCGDPHSRAVVPPIPGQQGTTGQDKRDFEGPASECLPALGYRQLGMRDVVAQSLQERRLRARGELGGDPLAVLLRQGGVILEGFLHESALLVHACAHRGQYVVQQAFGLHQQIVMRLRGAQVQDRE